MHVAKHWRNQKQRYRLIRKLARNGNEGSPTELKRSGSRPRNHEPDVMRVKILS